ncbi:hypothetical protein RI129_003303 [Pyrocoelia pectoralis]|uniref:Transmembrane protein 50A n=1 Tax=Pyrocoelia pectoralis TaxID=417401 RepID=A0AAN7ZUE2_9COLE
MFRSIASPFCCNFFPKTFNQNACASLISGLLFFTGWWLMIDTHVNYADIITKNGMYYLPGIASTMAFFIINMVPLRMIEEPYGYEDNARCSILIATIILFVGLVIAFSAVIGSMYILINDFLVVSEDSIWPGFAIFLQCIFIFCANLVMKFGTKSNDF